MSFQFKHKKMNCLYKILGAFLFFSSFLSISYGIAIMSVDLGSEWMKIAVVAPGKPMEIALNLESKRKTPICISFRDGVRAFGEDACTVGMRIPSVNYIFLLDLLGKKVDHPVVQLYRKRFPYYQIEAEPERGTVVFRLNANTTFTVEELMAQILDHARYLAVQHTEEKSIKDVVITVPSYFNQVERRCLKDAAELVGLKVLSLISSNAAVSLNYGMFRRGEITEKVQNILFYDMGSYSTSATIASYQTVKTKEKGYPETNPQVSILGVGHDRTLGGLEIQLRLRDHLAEQFDKQKKDKSTSIKDSQRAMAKLLKAADKLRTVLSANNQHHIHVEGVLGDEDFSHTMTRETFEEINADLFDRATGPIDKALIAAAMDLKDIDQVIIVGGSTRIPKIKKVLGEHLKKELGMSINADEAAALGAVYKAADLGTGFKVKTFHVKEANLYPIEVSFERTYEKEDGELDSKSVTRSLFPALNPCPQKKVMTFNKHTKDFGFSVNFDFSKLSKEDQANLGASTIAYVIVEGVTEVFAKYADQNDTTVKGIKAHFHLDDACVLNITSIEAVFEKNVTLAETEEKDESIFSKISNFVSGTGEDEAEKAESTTEAPEASGEQETDKKQDKDKKTTTDKDSSSSKTTKDTKTKKVKDPIVTIKENLTFKINYLDLKPMTEESKIVSMNKLEAINEAEKLRLELVKMRNTLESLTIEIKDKMEHEEYNVVAKPEEKEAVLAKASEFGNWLDDEDDGQILSFLEKVAALEALFKPIKSRVWEAQERPKILKELKDLLNSSNVFVSGLAEAAQTEKHLATIMITKLEESVNNTETWIEEMEEKQAVASPSGDPPMTVKKIARKMKDLNSEVQTVIQAVKIAKAMKAREEAEAKKKAAEEKAKAEKAAKAAKENETETPEPEVEEKSDSRQEPHLPEEPEEPTLTIDDDKSEDQQTKPETDEEDEKKVPDHSDL